MRSIVLSAVILLSSAAQASITSLTDGSTVSWDLSSAPNAKLTLTGDRHTLANPSNGSAGQIYSLIVDDQGHPMEFGTAYKTAGGQNPVYPPIGVTELQFQWDGSSMLQIPASDVRQTVFAPSGLSASSNQTGQVSLSWSNNDGSQTGVRVQRYDSSIGQWGDVTSTLSSSANSYTDTVDAGTYNYRVMAVRSSAVSIPSAEASGTSL